MGRRAGGAAPPPPRTGEPPVRTLALWCPDWSVVAAGHAEHELVAVVAANRVVACSAAARAEGVRHGLRRREAQARAPDLVVVAADPSRDARLFEPVVAAVDAVVPGVEVLRPGLAVIAASGAARYFGGEQELVDLLAGVVVEVGHDARFGVADGTFAAVQAAYALEVVPPGTSRTFLAPLAVSTLGDPDLADLLARLGIRTLGAFAALPDDDVLARFGPEGERRHRLARGLAERPPVGAEPPPDLMVEAVLDPPLERVDAATFVAKQLADRLVDRLDRRGVAVTRVRVEAVTGGDGDADADADAAAAGTGAEARGSHELARVWRHDDGFTAVALAERVRWQLDGWLSGTVGTGRPGAGVTVLRLVPVEVVDAGRQLQLWGDDARGQERVERAVDRVLGLLGPTAVVTPVLAGGRDVAGRVRAVPWGERRGPDPVDARPWPGRMPVPSPATVRDEPVPATLVAADGEPVGVTGRLEATAAPARLAVDGAGPVDVVGWAGPWASDVRWWDPAATRRQARVQVVTADDRAHLLVLEEGRWAVEATYD